MHDWSLILSALAIALIFPVSALSLTLMLARHERLAAGADQDHAIAEVFSDARDLQQFEQRVMAERERRVQAAQRRYGELARTAVMTRDPREWQAWLHALQQTEARVRGVPTSWQQGAAPPGTPTEPTTPSAPPSVAPTPTPAPAAQVRRLVGGRGDRAEET